MAAMTAALEAVRRTNTAHAYAVAALERAFDAETVSTRMYYQENPPTPPPRSSSRATASNS
jgi:hypothetical protein